jgi:hypothetical protein
MEVTKLNLALRFTPLVSFITEIYYHCQIALFGWPVSAGILSVNVPRLDRSRRKLRLSGHHGGEDEVSRFKISNA